MRILSLNANRNTPLEKQQNLLKSVKPDVICMQEVREDMYEKWVRDFKYNGNFSAQWFEYIGGRKINIGLAILTPHDTTDQQNYYYRGNNQEMPDFNSGNIDQIKIPRVLQTMDLLINDEVYRVANLHFTWSSNGVPSSTQILDAAKVRNILETFNGYILCGDFNTPVGGEVFEIIRNQAQLAELRNCNSTIDLQYHYAKDLRIIVDAVLFTKEYSLQSIEVVCGVSDHCALFAEMKRANK